MENPTQTPVSDGSNSPVTPVAPLEPVDPVSMASQTIVSTDPSSDQVASVPPVVSPIAPAAVNGVHKFEVLLAEDEEDARLIYLDILNSTEWNIDGAENGQITLDKLAAKKYDLLLLDIIMPDLDGLTVLSEVKKNPEKYGTPKVVMLTNIGGDLAIEKALGMGSLGYMLKSETEPEDLVTAVRSYLEKGQAPAK